MRWHRAAAKLNLSLRVLGRRTDGFHDLESLVAFAELSDWLGFQPGDAFELIVEGPGADAIGPIEDNLVTRAARALSRHVPGLKLGKVRLIKRLPAAAGLGGGSADAAACLRALAEANGLSLDDERLLAAAAETGSDVPVCLASCARVMAGVGDRLGAPVRLPRLFALLANPRRALPTRDVFAALGLARGSVHSSPFAPDDPGSVSVERLAVGGNDLQPPAQMILPLIGDIVERLKALPGARLARMSGSGATCFAVFDDPEAVSRACRRLAADKPEWWTAATPLR